MELSDILEALQPKKVIVAAVGESGKINEILEELRWNHVVTVVESDVVHPGTAIVTDPQQPVVTTTGVLWGQKEICK